MLQNAYFLAKIGADTAENEQHLAEILPIGRRAADRCPGLRRRHGRHDRVGHADEPPGHADEDDELGQLLVCVVQAVVQEQPEYLNY